MNNKKLYRVEEGKMIAGVCGGVAEYFNLDVSIVRVLWVLGSLFVGSGLVIYIAMAFILPVKSEVYPNGINPEEKKNN